MHELPFALLKVLDFLCSTPGPCIISQLSHVCSTDTARYLDSQPFWTRVKIVGRGKVCAKETCLQDDGIC
jgi:hypothetical protein